MFERAMGHFYKHFVIMRKSPSELAWIFVYPFIGILSIGLLATYFISIGAPLDMVIFVLVGTVTWNFYDISQRAVTYGITFDIWGGCLKHGIASPSRARDFIMGNGIFGYLSAMVAMILVGILGLAVLNFNIFAGGFYLLLSLTTIFIFATAMGLMIDYLVITKGHNYVSLIWSSTGIVMIFSGVYYPITILPEVVQTFAMVLPTTHALSGLRAYLGITAGDPLLSIVMASGLSIFYFIISVGMYKMALRKGRESGIVTWY
ncbi:MAG: ABC transporter permease [Candidatus Aenigmarchaeota archaeon]|nr:ABC transporter permease [Candidatus Aenigmarchaeota archaeon]